MPDPNSETRQRLFNEGTEYIPTTEPIAFMTVRILNCSVSVNYLQQKRTALTVKWGSENIPNCFHSIIWQRRRITQPQFLWQFSSKEKNLAHYSTFSFKLFHLVQTRVYSCSRLRRQKTEKSFSVQFSTPHLHKGQLRHPGKALPLKFPGHRE